MKRHLIKANLKSVQSIRTECGLVIKNTRYEPEPSSVLCVRCIATLGSVRSLRPPKNTQDQRGLWLKSLSPERRKEISTMGGKALSKNREHMAEIGRRGGVKVSKDKEHMRRIGKVGGRSSALLRKK